MEANELSNVVARHLQVLSVLGVLKDVNEHTQHLVFVLLEHVRVLLPEPLRVVHRALLQDGRGHLSSVGLPTTHFADVLRDGLSEELQIAKEVWVSPLALVRVLQEAEDLALNHLLVVFLLLSLVDDVLATA